MPSAAQRGGVEAARRHKFCAATTNGSQDRCHRGLRRAGNRSGEASVAWLADEQSFERSQQRDAVLIERGQMAAQTTERLDACCLERRHDEQAC